MIKIDENWVDILSNKFIIRLSLFCFATIIIAIVFLFLLRVKSPNEEYFEKKVKDLESEIQFKILEDKDKLDSLNAKVLKLRLQSVEQEITIDSLKKVKSKIQIKYQQKTEQASNFTTIESLNYWTNKFEND